MNDISFSVRAGEVLGIAGVQGNGQRELAEALTGLRAAEAGTMLLEGENVHLNDPRFLIEHGMAHIPEDRQKHGLVLPYSIIDNLVLCTYYKAPFASGMRRNPRAMMENALRLIEEFDVRTPGPRTAAAAGPGTSR